MIRVLSRGSSWVASPKFALLALALVGCSMTPGLGLAEQLETASSKTLPGWELVWEDDFSGKEVDDTSWEVLHRSKNHNAEKQFYVPEQATVRDGMLRIEATDEPLEEKAYRSARMRTWQTWSHGRFESRIKLPTTKGIWPAFWLVPRDVGWPTGGEIDIMEAWGSTPLRVNSAYHWGVEPSKHKYVHNRHTAKQATGVPVNFHEGFHTYAAEWEPRELRFFVDGKLHYTVTQEEAPIHDTPKAVTLNVAVGGFFDGNPDASTQFPQVMEVDYVRIWQRPQVSKP